MGYFLRQSLCDKVGNPIHAQDLPRHDIIAYSGLIRGWSGYQWFESQIDLARSVSRTNGILRMPSLVQTVMGVGAMPGILAKRAPDLVPCFASPQMVGTFCLVTAVEARKSPVIRVFIDLAVPQVVKAVKALTSDAPSFALPVNVSG